MSGWLAFRNEVHVILFNRSSRKQSLIAVAVASAAVFAASENLNASVDTWIGTTSGSWADATNWQPGTAPASGDDLLFSNQGTAATTSNDIASLSVANITFDSTAQAYTLNGPNVVTLTANVTNASSNLQTLNLPVSFSGNVGLLGGTSGLTVAGALTDTGTTGNQALTLGGIGTLTDNLVSATGGTLVVTTAAGSNWTMLASGSAVTLAKGQINLLAGGTFSFGTATSAPNLIVTAVGSDHTVGDAASSSTFNMVSGTLLLKTRMNTINGTVNVNGGALQVWNQFQESNGALTNVSTVNINGGSMDVRNSSGSASTGGTFVVASRGQGTLNMNGGTLTVGTLDVSRGASAAVSGVASQGIVNLNGGTLIVNNVATASANTSGTGAGSTAVFNFNGGTLKARACQQHVPPRQQRRRHRRPYQLHHQEWWGDHRFERPRHWHRRTPPA